MKVRDLLKMLSDDGWFVVRTRGSHRQLRHSTKPGTVTVTVAGKPGVDIPRGTLGAIIRQAGLKK